MAHSCGAAQAAIVFAFIASAALAAPPPYAVAPGLFDPSQDDLGLKDVPGTEHITVFTPAPDTDKFVNGVVPIAFQGKLYVQWQSSARDEDSPDSHTVYALSTDGRHFSPPMTLSITGKGMQTSGGWAADRRSLIAFLNLWPDGFRKADGSHPGGHTLFRRSHDGRHWSAAQPVTGADEKPVPGIIEQDPHDYGHRLFTAFHRAPGLIVTPYYSHDRLGISGWRAGKMPHLPHSGDVSRALEPSLFRQKDGCIVMVFRDQAASFRQLAAQSCNGGVRFSRPVLTNMPDSGAKQSAGNLPDGTAYLINVPKAAKPRYPLAITLADDGHHFTRAFRIRGRASLPELKYPGTYKRPGYHYPKTTYWNGALWVGYAVNKEQVALSRIPISGLIAAQTEHKH